MSWPRPCGYHARFSSLGRRFCKRSANCFVGHNVFFMLMLGPKHSEVKKERMRLSHLGKKRPDMICNQWKKGTFAWNKDLKGVQVAWNKGKKCLQISQAVVGEKNHNWKGGKETRRGRHNASSSKRRATQAGNGGFHTWIEWEALKMKYRYMCLCCKQSEPEIKLTRDHIIPILR